MTGEVQGRLKREIGIPGAMMMGLGSIVGTGVFVSIGLGADIAGSGVLTAIVLAAGLATCNGLSSAQLAASHPVSGGTYEYGYRYLNPFLGFTAGWMFLLAKSASAATAALGFAGYTLHLFGIEQRAAQIGLALVGLLLLTALVAGGIKGSNRVNSIIVTVTLMSLGILVLLGLPRIEWDAAGPIGQILSAPDGIAPFLRDLFHASALMFVAFTGYGRIATLGEEVTEPKRTIPKAIIATLIASMVLYLAVAVVGVGIQGPTALAESTKASGAPLEDLARVLAVPGLPALIAVGAVTAMLGVLLNLILGLSRVLLAMGRRRDMPALFGVVDSNAHTPRAATFGIGLLVAGLICLGDLKTTWTFSAFTVLVYYAVTNLAALFLEKQDRRFPKWVSWLGLVGCLFLAVWVEIEIWLAGLALLSLGWLWFWLRLKQKQM